MDALRSAVLKIGEEVVQCLKKCPTIYSSLSEGVLPRYLILDENHCDVSKPGCVIMGMNPGEPTKAEKKHYKRIHKENKCLKYSDERSYWQDNLRPGKGNNYFDKLGKLKAELGIMGPTLWTNLAKCQRAGDVKTVSDHTLRFCANIFLASELKNVPESWVVIGVSHEAYNALRYLQPQRAVIGCPHPTGGGGGAFNNLFENNESELSAAVKASTLEAIQNRQAWWLHI